MKRALSLIVLMIFLSGISNTAYSYEEYKEGEGEHGRVIKQLSPYFEEWDQIITGSPNPLIYAAKKDGKWGIIDTFGNIVVEPMYKEITVNIDFVRILDTNDKYGYLDGTGRMMIEPKYDYADPVFLHNMAVVGRDFGYTVINMQGNEIMPLQPSMLYMDQKGEFFYYREDGNATVLDLSGTKIFEGKYDRFDMYSKDFIIAGNDGKLGAINMESENILPFEFDSIVPVYDYGTPFSIDKSILFASKWERAGYFNMDGTPVGDFKYAPRTRLIFGNILLISEDDKYGLMDRQGNIVIEPAYNLIQIQGGIIIMSDGANFIEINYKKEPYEISEAQNFEKDMLEADWLKAQGIIKGDENGNLRLYDTITRAEFVTMIARAVNWELDENIANNFTDTENHWAKLYISKAVEEGIISGYEDNKFMPDRKIQIDEANLIIFRLFGASEEFINESSPEFDGVRDVSRHLFWAKIFPAGGYGAKDKALREYTARLIYNYMHTDATIEEVYEKSNRAPETTL